MPVRAQRPQLAGDVLDARKRVSVGHAEALSAGKTRLDRCGTAGGSSHSSMVTAIQDVKAPGATAQITL
jgi:hypothetical protein